ncbi:protein PAXX isoform X4 [Sceloporus undulatus]|uniref:protein PAXX isoform X4 n=1 Tax=Sceloporus undulatus TaxID=8520 RepID=UPI001C4C0FD3|nr:protein PAXX isoform X4 [Sceloporus undulatus]
MMGAASSTFPRSPLRGSISPTLATCGVVRSQRTNRAAIEVLAHQTPTLTLRDSVATLCFQDGGQRLAFDLSKVPLSEARKPLQELMFGLVARVHALEERLQERSASAAPSPVSSPEKATLRGQSIFAPDISPAKCKTGAGQASTKKRLPGESLINPGFKSKKKPKGVDFEDP